MKFSKSDITVIICCILIVVFVSVMSFCEIKHLRGSVTPSEDGKTYLVVADDNGGKCGPILVDGKVWEYKIDEAGPISAGTHTIECGTKIEFSISDSVVFQFDYWGP